MGRRNWKKGFYAMKYTHVVFDIDGTLTDTEKYVLESLCDVVRTHTGREETAESLRFALGIPGREAFRRIGFEAEHFAEYMAEWETKMRRFNDEIDIFPGGRELVAALDKAGVKLGIATSKTRDQYDKDFGRFDVAARFPVSVTADDSETHKPAAGPLLKYMELTGAKREEMLYIGDSIYDSQCAANAGVDFALAVWGATDRTVAAKYRPETPISSMSLGK